MHGARRRRYPSNPLIRPACRGMQASELTRENVMLQRASVLPRLSDTNLARTKAWIDGEWTDGSHGSFPVTNPADAHRLAEVANCGAADATRAIGAAQRAWPAWRAKTAKEREQARSLRISA